ncbi:MAG: xanthine dehydrogenase family protein molybdopterin-binding subunit [Acidimicrobiaceae bacterium]|nr:xanthine dehydrogenase family protein molybdopterin-binding subunit [Acidimicrobiaceae bacterium]
MPQRFVGESVTRVEDRRILTGRGRYVDDVRVPGMLHAAFLRSPFAHARISRINVADARELPGVVAVFTGADIEAATVPIQVMPQFPDFRSPTYLAMATDRVRFVGDLVAIVVAESRYVAEDALEMIDVDYDTLPPVVSFADAQDPRLPPLFDDVGGNVLYRVHSTHGPSIDSAFSAADMVIKETFTQSRQANVPMETRGAVAEFDPATDELTYYAATQSPQGCRYHLATYLNHPIDRVRVLSGDVGGAFGLKGPIHRDDIALAAASRILGRPIKWIEDRNEHLQASGHAREEQMEVEAAVTAEGRLLGLKARLLIDQGAFPCLPYAAVLFPTMIRDLLPGPYRFEAMEFEGLVLATNKAWNVPYRGPWEIETWVRERLMDVIARRIGMDPADLRRSNLIDGAAEDRMLSGMSVAGITSRESLERALKLADYPALRQQQQEGRAAGRVMGIGFATFLEAAPGPKEARVIPEDARVRLEPNGHLLVMTPQGPHGQGHETTLAQVAADAMGVPLDHVRVVHGDTRQTPVNLIGTGGSRASTWASGAVLATTRKVRDKALAVASSMMEIDVSDLDIEDGVVTPAGAPAKAMPLAAVAGTAYLAPESLPPGTDNRLEAQETFSGAGVGGSGWSGGTHLCVVDVDLDTGQVRIPRYIVVEDCGQIINPAIVEGQIRGGVAQGIAGVLFERAAYDEEGQFLAGTFMDYLVPTASEIPDIEVDHIESVPAEGVDIRGVGEGGAIVAPAALTNAIEDALAHLGVTVTEQYLPPSRILELAGVVPAESS